MAKPKVLILTQPLSELAEHVPEFKEFKTLFEVEIYEISTQEHFQQKLATDYNDISAIWVTGASIMRLGGILENIDHFPQSLKVYVFSWVGYLEQEATALKNRGIKFCNIGDVSSHDVADIALYLTLACFRLPNYFQKQFYDSRTIWSSRQILGSDGFDEHGEPLPPPFRKNLASSATVGGKRVESPTGKVVGIIGLGSIGKEIAKRLNVIGMKIRYTKRTPLSEKELEELGFDAVYYKLVEEMIQEVDLIVNAAPHSPETTNILNEESLKKVKKGIRIVNIGRGTILDEDALFRALDDGTVCSVGLDVYQNEPSNIDPRFFGRYDIIACPHLGNVSQDNIINASLRCIENIKNVLLEGGDGVTPVL